MFKEYFIYNLATTTLAGSDGTAFTNVQMVISNNDFIFKRTIHNATSNLIYKKIFDNESGRFLFKGSEDLRAVSGVPLSGLTSYGFTPYNWPIPYKAKRNNIIQVSLSDFSTSSNTVDIAYHGESEYESAPIDCQGKPLDYSEKRTVVPIAYESATITPAATTGSKAQGIMTTDNDADFVCTKLAGIATGAGYITIQDLGRDCYWQNDKTFVSNLIGNGQFPNVFPSPRFIGRNSKLLITFENNTDSANSLILYFHGYKRF